MKSKLWAPVIAALLGACALVAAAAPAVMGQTTAVTVPSQPDFSKIKTLLLQQSQERVQFNKSRKAAMKAYAASLKGLPAQQRFAALARENQSWESQRQALVRRQRSALESARKQAAAKP